MQTIHMKCQVLLTLKTTKKKKIWMLSAVVVIGALWLRKAHNGFSILALE